MPVWLQGLGALAIVVALMVGSWYGVAASALLIGGIVFRTAMEDRTLQRELPGYAAYAAHVRYRLIPGVW
jgi:protein-S-isoprenylcysteine O-methyltransferase Ste14